MYNIKDHAIERVSQVKVNIQTAGAVIVLAVAAAAVFWRVKSE
jgi:hypothetical protein